MARGSVTLSEVADAAGVSVSTASRALSGTNRISEGTRARVRATADRLGFLPDALAQSFASGRSQTIGVMTHRAANPLSRSVFIGLAVELGSQSRALLLCDEETEQSLEATIAQLRARRIDGLIVVGDGTSEVRRSLSGQVDVPVVYAFATTENADDIVVTSDDHEIGRMAAQHLLNTGRRRIAHITAEPTSLAARGRSEGALEVLREAGLDWVTPIRWGEWTDRWGESAAGAMLSAGIEFDAVFCGNDHIAHGVERTMKENGLRVPEDVALIGVDNWDRLMIDQRVQHLTTIDVRLERIGALAGKILIEGSQTPGPVYVEPQLVIAETT